MYTTVEEAKQKLQDTVVAHKNMPFYVLEARGKTDDVELCGFYCSDNRNVLAVNILDYDFDFRNLGERLGYCNLKCNGTNEALYLMRRPVRRSVQGLSQYNVYLPSFLSDPTSEGRWSFNDVYKTKGFQEAFTGEYPSLCDVSKLLSEDKSVFSVAFAREFCISKDTEKVGPYYLKYKSRSIGYTEDLYRFKLSDKYKYLSNEIEKLEASIAWK